MSLRRYAQFALTLPILVPLIFIASLFTASILGIKAPDGVVQLGLPLLMSLLLGGLPYSVCALLANVALRSRGKREHIIASLAAAPLFAVVMFMLLFGICVVDASISLSESAFVASIYAALSFGFAIFYILIAYALLAALMGLGVVDRSAPFSSRPIPGGPKP